MEKRKTTVEEFFDTENFEQKGREYMESLEKDGSFQKMMGISEEAMESKFKYGQVCYRKQDFESAKEVFAYLSMLNPYVQKFWMSLGSAQIRLEAFEDAITSYTVASTLNEKDPRPHYCSAFAYVSLGQSDEAEQSLKMAIEIAKRDDAHRELERQAEKMLSKLKK